VNAATSIRKTADERREEILAAALEEFGEHGLDGTSTDTIARKAGISQPYLFRLFGTKKELYLETVRRCLSQTLELFEQAADGLHGEEAMNAIGQAYPEVAKFELIDYKVRILDQGHGTDAVTRVLIETTDGRSSWVTVGVGHNVIEASWGALVDAVTYGLRRNGEVPA